MWCQDEGDPDHGTTAQRTNGLRPRLTASIPGPGKTTPASLVTHPPAGGPGPGPSDILWFRTNIKRSHS